MAGKFSRLVAILKSAPRQIIAAYKKGYSEAPAVPPPEALRKWQNPPASRPKNKDLPPK